MAKTNMKASEMAANEMVCLIVETKQLQEAIDKVSTCAEGGLFTLYVQNRVRKFRIAAGEIEMTRCALVATCATAQAMASLYATVRTFKDGTPAGEGVNQTLEVTLQKEFAADIAACEGFPQVVIGISAAGIRVQAQNAENDEREFFIALCDETPARFSNKGGSESLELTVSGQEFAEAVMFAAAGAYAPEKGGNLVSMIPEISQKGVELVSVGFDQTGAARSSINVKEVSDDHEALRAFFTGFCPVDAKRLQVITAVEGLKTEDTPVTIRFFQDMNGEKRAFRRVDLLIGENIYMLVASSREIPAAIMSFFGNGRSNAVMTVDVRALGKAVGVAEIGAGKTAAVVITVEGNGESAGLRISDKAGTHNAKCMKVKVAEAPEGATITCGTGMLRNALKNAGDSAEFRFCHGAVDPIRITNVKGWQAVFMPVQLKDAEGPSEQEQAE